MKKDDQNSLWPPVRQEPEDGIIMEMGHFRNNLWRILEERGLDPEDLVKYCGEEDARFINVIIYSDRANPSIETALGISDALGVKLTEIWTPGAEDDRKADNGPRPS